MKTENISLEEFQKRSKKLGKSIPLVKAEATVNIFDKNGKLKSTLKFSTEDLDHAT